MAEPPFLTSCEAVNTSGEPSDLIVLSTVSAIMPRGSHLRPGSASVVWECWMKFWEQQEAEDSLFFLLLPSSSSFYFGPVDWLEQHLYSPRPPSLFPPTSLHRRLLDPWPPAPHSAGLHQNQTDSPNVGAAFF